MGCSSSAPFATDGGVLGEVKHVADDMVESGEQAMHGMGEAAGKAAHEAVDHVKGALSTAAGSVQSAVDNVGNLASNAAHSISDGIRRETSILTAPATPEGLGNIEQERCQIVPLNPDDGKKDNAAMKSSTPKDPSPISTESVPPLEKFRPTPVPSFDKPPTPGQTSPLESIEKSLEKIEEVNPTLDQLTDELLKETEAVASDVTSKMSDTVRPMDIMKTKLPPIELPKLDMEGAKAEMISNMDAAMGEKIDDSKAAVNETAEMIAETLKDAIGEVAGETGADASNAMAEAETEDQDYELPPTKWEALADAIVELPPRMSIDLGTGQLYAVIVDDEGTSKSSRSRPPVLKEHSSENQAAKSAL